MAAPLTCPGRGLWLRLLDGDLPEREQADLAGHLNHCPRCQEVMENLTAGSDVWLGAARSLKQEATTPPAPALRRVIHELKEEGQETLAPADQTPTLEQALDFLSAGGPAGPGGRLGPYQVVRVVGRGGMGVVLQAFDPALNRHVAIKVLAPQWASSAAARQRFAREAQATAALCHDHVVAIHGVDEVQGLPYLVMEYVQGVSLQQQLDRAGPPDLAEILRIGKQTAAGLAAAHERGLIHRDVKPSNILLEEETGRVKLSDFGLARAVDDASLTQSGVIAGTPQYMAPEQARGEAQDHRADLFSLGSVLYALCTGRPPFRAATTLAVLRSVCEDTPPPIRDVNPDIPTWLVEVIDWLHAKDPADRFQSAAEVARRLDQHLAHLQYPDLIRPPRRLGQPPRRAGAPPAGRRRLRFGLLGAGGLLAAVAVGLALAPGGLFRSGSDSGERDNRAARPDGQRVPVREGPEVILSNGRLIRQLGARFSFQVDYRFTHQAPVGGCRYVWVITSPRGEVYRHPCLGTELRNQGTLHGGMLILPFSATGTLETYLEMETLVGGPAGWQREKISNSVRLLP
jgi:serine/threonine-protein kinase